MLVEPGTEERITHALREWHETNTFKKVSAAAIYTSLFGFASRYLQDCSNRDILLARLEDEEDNEDD